ncbi:hypothetical protein HN358_02600 [Candidatus Uhrbacteria bacterium]|jgi:hypothetical protein|nr:hypothetical protein [Candidatus Uhrbacteria bacterium]MBT7717569.1 hypothetical protein [Candidatus Uhrbacteria bacterium]
MQKALQNRVFAVVTIAAMLLGSLSAVLVPSTASAAGAGDLIKNESLSTVYYYAPDGTRFIFPNEKTYMTWYQDFDEVETISDSDLADIAMGGNIVYRPGTSWIKIQSNPKVYAVATDGTIHWIETEDVAVDYAGADWAEYVQDVPDVFFPDYDSGTSLTAATAYDGLMYMDGSDYYISWGGEKLLVSDLDANNMVEDFYLAGEGIDDSALTAGDEVTGEDAAIVDASQQGGVEATEVTGGDVDFSLSSSNPAGTSVPTNANTVEVLSFDIEAGDEATEVDQVAVKMVGLSSTTDVTNVYLYEGSTRLTEARSVNSSTRKATFGSLNLALDAGETRTITVRVTIDASAGDELQFAVYEVDDVTADGDVSGSFPLEGNTFEVSGTTIGTVTIIDTGSVSNPSLGANDAEIGSFKVTTATEAGNVQSLTLKIANADDHDDYRMLADDEEVATGEYIGDKLVVFDFDEDYEISKGGSEIFTVTADIGGDAADTITMYMDNAIDVMVEGAEYGFAMAATITGYDQGTCTTDGDECNYSTIQGGEVTFDTYGPTAGDIRTNSQDQTLLEFTLTSMQDITVKDLDIVIVANDEEELTSTDPFNEVDDEDSDGADDAGVQDATGDDDGLVNTDGEANITDIRIVNADTGDTLMGPLELDSLVAAADDAGQIIDFTDDFDMDAGETLTLAVVVDVDDTITSGTEIGAIIDISGFVAEDVNGDTLTNSTDVVPTSDMYEGAQKATSASLTIALSTVPGDVTTIHGMEDVGVGKFNITGGDAGQVDISSITMDVYLHDDDVDGSDDDFSQAGNCSAAECAVIAAIVTVTDYLESCSIYDIDGNLLDGPKSPSSSGSLLVFDDVDWTIESGESEVLDLHCDFSNPVLSTTVYFAFDIDDMSELVIAEDQDGTDVDPTTDSPNGDYSTPTNVVTLAASGSIAITADSSMPSADILLTGTTDNHVASYNIAATNEDFEVTILTFHEEQSEDDTGTADDSGYTNNISLVTLEYPIEDGTTETATATMSGNAAKFTLSSAPLYVSTEDDVTIDVYVDVPATDRTAGGSATSNEKIRMGFSDADNSGTENFKAVGVGSGTTLGEDATGVDDVGHDYYTTDGVPTFVVQETKPTISLSSSSPSGTSIPGDIEVYRFNVSAASNEDAVLRELVWKFSSTDNASSSWNFCDQAGVGDGEIAAADMDLYDLTDLGTALDDDAEWSFHDSATAATAVAGTREICTDSTDVVDYIALAFSTDAETITVPAGETKTFALYMDLTGASATNDDSVQLTLASSTDLTWVDDVNIADAALTISDTTITVGADSTFDAGDQICFTGADTTCDAGEEIALITVKSTNDITLVRGYLGTDFILPVTTQNLSYRADPLYWEDDGTAGTLATVAASWGSYLVDSLPVTGNALQF